jgi:thiamine-phosphate pyrophosphorylase
MVCRRRTYAFSGSATGADSIHSAGRLHRSFASLRKTRQKSLLQPYDPRLAIMTWPPRFYAIVDSALLEGNVDLVHFAEALVSAGCTLLQYRNKSDNARVMLEQARELKRVLSSARDQNPHAGLIMNDRADLCLAAGFDGVHVGQDDLSPKAVRAIIGPDRWLGVSTHNPEQLCEADLTSANYLAIGPVFTTSSKNRPDPIVGLEGVRLARSLTRKPLVAIGGITRANAASVIEAGADSVAVISDLIKEPRKSAEEFFRILG